VSCVRSAAVAYVERLAAVAASLVADCVAPFDAVVAFAPVARASGSGGPCGSEDVGGSDETGGSNHQIMVDESCLHVETSWHSGGACRCIVVASSWNGR
jgi:hypothetical protein